MGRSWPVLFGLRVQTQGNFGEAVLEQVLEKTAGPVDKIVATGYGRVSFSADVIISEITAHPQRKQSAISGFKNCYRYWWSGFQDHPASTIMAGSWISP